MTVSRAMMRYHGGKWTLAPWIISFFGQHKVYVEPFAGAASVLLRKPPSWSEVYNDLNQEIVNVFRVMRDPVTAELLRDGLRLTPFARAEFVESYEDGHNPVERARRTILRSFMGFGSASTNREHMTGFRAHSRRSGSTPTMDWYRYPDAVHEFCDRLRRVTIESKPAREVIQQQDTSETLFYVDPPYPLETRGNNSGVRQKYTHELDERDHRLLLEQLIDAQGMVILSSYPNDLYDAELARAGWYRNENSAYADGARERTEILWLNPSAKHANVNAMLQQSLVFGGAPA
jgi:DNA adenine methylase